MKLEFLTDAKLWALRLFNNIGKKDNMCKNNNNEFCVGLRYDSKAGNIIFDNTIEKYYSTSLKTHRKKQFRTDIGIINQLQLSSMKRAGMFNEKKPTLIERFMAFIPFINY